MCKCVDFLKFNITEFFEAREVSIETSIKQILLSTLKGKARICLDPPICSNIYFGHYSKFWGYNSEQDIKFLPSVASNLVEKKANK